MFKIHIKMKQITLNIKDSHYTLFVQFLPSYGNAAEKQRSESADPKKKKFTVVKVAAADRNYTFNREELNAR